jgi:hypothetical protein
VPVLAAGLADVLVVDANPRMCGRVRCHLLDQLAIGLLGNRVLVQIGPHLLDPGREPVAHLLQLIDGEQTRSSQPRHREVDPLAGERGAEQAGEGQLHRGDLPAQVGAGGALVMLVDEGVEACRGRWRNQRLLGREHLVDLSSFE